MAKQGGPKSVIGKSTSSIPTARHREIHLTGERGDGSGTGAMIPLYKPKKTSFKGDKRAGNAKK